MRAAISMPRHIWRLSELLVGIVEMPVDVDVSVSGISHRSHEVRPGDLFIALAGARTHGLQYLRQAISNGAVAVLWEPYRDFDRLDLSCEIPHLQVPRLSRLIGLIADRFFHHPSQDMTLIGVTGTDGKTSVSHFIAQALNSSVHPCGVIGTLGYGVYGNLVPGSHTTPDAICLQAELSTMRDQGAKWVAMEVSSHGLDQGRVKGTAFNAAILTNLTRDHFDYHGSLESYASAKSRLFEMPGLRHAILNLDDEFGCKLADTLREKVQLLGYSLNGEEYSSKAVVRAIRHEFNAKGFYLDIETPWGRGDLNCKLMGRFNAENVLATLAVLLVLELPLEEALRRLHRLRAVAGRMEAFGGKDKPLVVVDYAHTPAALQQALVALREHCRGRLWCVFGCGGERDAGKRLQMGQVSESLADKIILTDDNPRNEPPESIVRDILAGIVSRERVSVIHERSRAIATAIDQARLHDVILVAGKGHEQVQIARDQRIPFCDREQVLTYLHGVSR